MTMNKNKLEIDRLLNLYAALILRLYLNEKAKESKEIGEAQEVESF